MEHPYGKSWGYQTTGYFAPTSRWGEPKDLMYLIDKCHRAGIGVILDWVPSHFPKDAHGLVEFDGEPLYEAHGADRQEQPQWGTRCFDYGRTEVQSFLVSSAFYWLELFHADGLRVDAVSSMLYLDFGKESGQWTPNAYGNNMNLEAIALIKKLNRAVFEHYPGAIMAAEESTAFPMVTKPIHQGGLGFNFKWNMGWMNDVLDYIKTDPLFRKYKHDKICFSFQYAYTENFILPISHDEVVHGKASLLNKMPGGYEEKFAGLRAFLGYMYTHPGKKLNFMGAEFGQFIEWNEEDSLDWHLLDYPMHRKLHNYVKALNRFYLDNPALWEKDFSSGGFNWISGEDREQNILLYERCSKSGEKLIVLQNFAPEARYGYRVGVDSVGAYSEIFNSDLAEFGGWNIRNEGTIISEPIPCHGRQDSVSVTIPPMATAILTLGEIGL
jgi:1,4-alpha-glucan branching enzyme